MAYTGITTSITCIARYNYYAHNDDELTFKKGERFLVLEKSTSHGWFVVERISNGEKGLAPGNYFRKEAKAGESPRANNSSTSPRQPTATATTTTSTTTITPTIPDPDTTPDDPSDAPPPPLPGPPPKWSDTIAGQEALKLLALHGHNIKPGTSGAKKSPRSVVGVFDSSPAASTPAADPTKPAAFGELSEQGAAAWGIHLKKSPRSSGARNSGVYNK